MYTLDSPLVSGGVGTRHQWLAELRRRGADEPEQIVDAYLKYCPLVGVNHDLAIAQAIVECDGFKDYKWTQYRNPAGIGSTSREAQGNVFDSIEAGITAQLSHQCAYAYTADTCPVEKLGAGYEALFNDPRHALVGHRGHPEIGYLNGKWAIPGDQYAQDICAVANAVVGDAQPLPTPAPPPNGGTAHVDIQIVDIRGELETNPNGGPGQSYAPKRGVIVHYNGPAVTRPGREQLTIDASYHCHKDWSADGSGAYGDGIMYHYAVDENGMIYQLRDADAVLWHCGYWGTPGNQDGTAVQVTIGEGQNATPAQLASLTQLVDWLRARDGFGPEMAKGHQEVNPTACPGSLMQDFVYPYRAGNIGGGTVANAFRDDVTGKLVANAMLDFYTDNGGVAVIGRPLTEEFDGEWPDDPQGAPKRTMQIFERNVLGFFPENEGKARVQALRLGAKFAKEHGFTGVGI